MYTIIEDCSPYYIRFTFDGLKNIINYTTNQTPINMVDYPMYSHDTLNSSVAETIISMLPMSNKIIFNINRVAIFTTPPGGGCGIHKDGSNHRTSFNISIEILDNNCITNWYSDETFDGFPFLGNFNYTRNVYCDYKTMNKFKPIKTMIAQPNEMTLFNTEIYHSWSNSNSNNARKILTLRSVNVEKLYFDDVKKILFGS
jgi:hypothetical protein